MTKPPLLVVLMGPTGCGKSTLAMSLARKTDGAMIEGDDYHSLEARTKMAGGTPLDDGDRAGWVDRLTAAVLKSSNTLVWLACSALTTYVQERLRKESGRDVSFVLLNVPTAILRSRLDNRTDHFMPSSLVDSQIAALSEPEDAIRIDADRPLSEVRADIVTALGLTSSE